MAYPQQEWNICSKQFILGVRFECVINVKKSIRVGQVCSVWQFEVIHGLRNAFIGHFGSLKYPQRSCMNSRILSEVIKGLRNTLQRSLRVLEIFSEFIKDLKLSSLKVVKGLRSIFRS